MPDKTIDRAVGALAIVVGLGLVWLAVSRVWSRAPILAMWVALLGLYAAMAGYWAIYSTTLRAIARKRLRRWVSE